MSEATRRTVTAVGIYAGLLGMAHGYFALQQGAVAPPSPLFPAIGPPCQPAAIYHACFPALTLLPTLQLSGIAAMTVGLLMVVWSAFFVGRRGGGLVLLGLSGLLLLVGGGFIPAFSGVAAGAAATRIGRSPRLARPAWLAGLWPAALFAYVLWLLGQWALGTFANDLMLRLGGWPLALEFALLAAAIGSALAADQRQTARPPGLTTK